MPKCRACKMEMHIYDRRCRTCGARPRRRGVNILDAPTNAELSQARFCHLLALPGMLVLGVFNITATQLFGWWGLLPLNLALPSIYRILHRNSPFVWYHGAEVLNFQLLWTVAIAAVWFIGSMSGQAQWLLPVLLWRAAYLPLCLGGIILVLIISKDAANAGDGRYPLRIPLF